MKRILGILLCFTFVLGCVGCTQTTEDGRLFKREYESLNGQDNGHGHNYREITINENNPFIYADCADINRMMDEGKSFIVYFGANWCPWCRSILPTVIETAKKNKVKTIYYVDVKPNNDPEKEIRNVYAVNESGEIYRSHEGTEAYNEFITRAKGVLADYTRTDVESLNGTQWEGEKRVGAPNFVIVVKGEPVEMITGISTLLNDPYMELTDELLKDVADIFQRFFTRYNSSK